jgi:hypothetical protein
MPFIFEGDLDLGAIGLDLAVRDTKPENSPQLLAKNISH